MDTSGTLKCFYEAYTTHGLISAKLAHYFPIYDKVFRDFTEKQVRMLEIGVRNGGSLCMWDLHFKNAELILGIDITESCSDVQSKLSDKVKIEIGDQADEAFLTHIGKTYGPFDIILDDGGHQFHQQKISFETLFPYLSENGVYMVEDTHTSYDNYANIYPKDGVYGGGLKHPDTTIEHFKDYIDNLTEWAYDVTHGTCPLKTPKQRTSAKLTDMMHSVEFYDSICVIKRAHRPLPYVVFNNDHGLSYNNDSSLFN